MARGPGAGAQRAGELEPFARFRLAGRWDPDGTAMARRGEGRGPAGQFAETPRELHKMRYPWWAPVRLDHAKLAEFLGEEPYTPLGGMGWTLGALRVG